jgi:hypothetical protein
MSARKALPRIICFAVLASLFASIGIENAISPHSVSIKDDPNPTTYDLAVFSSDISVENPIMLGQTSTVAADIHNLGIAYINTWHAGDFVEYDFYQDTNQSLEVRIRIRTTGNQSTTEVFLDGASLAIFDATAEFDVVMIHDVLLSAGAHTLRVIQVDDDPTLKDDLLIDWLEIGSSHLEAEFYDRSDRNDPDPIYRGVDAIGPSRITAQFFVDDVLIGENFNIGNHSNTVTGNEMPHQEYFIQNNGTNRTSTQWTPSEPGDRVICIEVFAAIGTDSNITNNRACITVFVEAPTLLPPMLCIYAFSNGTDAFLYWEQLPYPGLDHYLLYRSTSQTSFDFDTAWVNTSTEINSHSGIVDPLLPMWIDRDAINASNPNYSDEYYYIIRAVNVGGEISTTSNTVGYYILAFNEGQNTFSPPLKPFVPPTLDTMSVLMNATSISWLDGSDDWRTYPMAPAPAMKLGKGYVAELSSPSRYVFTGEPASMIIYEEDFGFDSATRNDIIAEVDSQGNVQVTWPLIEGADKYYIYESSCRHGFFNGSFNVTEVAGPPYEAMGAASSTGELYYLIVPFNSTLGNGSSTYSIGVITEEYNGNEMFGLPLKPVWGDMSADWYVDQIPNTLGIVFLEEGIWNAHFKEFPEGVYDTTIEYGRGYELTVYAISKHTIIGW